MIYLIPSSLKMTLIEMKFKNLVNIQACLRFHLEITFNERLGLSTVCVMGIFIDGLNEYFELLSGC